MGLPQHCHAIFAETSESGNLKCENDLFSQCRLLNLFTVSSFLSVLCCSETGQPNQK